MIRDSFNDVIIEPQRQKLIPGFKDVQRGAMSAGALGCSISGAGPTIFAWAEIQQAEAVRGGHGRRIHRTWPAIGFVGFPARELRRQSGEGLMSDLKFASSRGGAPCVTLSEAIRQGLAPDGGLYVPTRLPQRRRCLVRRSHALARDCARRAGGVLRRRPAAARARRDRGGGAEFPAPTTPVTAARIGCSCSSCSMGPPPRSRTSARVSWPRACNAWRATRGSH
jgi:hypothetical protein